MCKLIVWFLKNLQDLLNLYLWKLCTLLTKGMLMTFLINIFSLLSSNVTLWNNIVNGSIILMFITWRESMFQKNIHQKCDLVYDNNYIAYHNSDFGFFLSIVISTRFQWLYLVSNYFGLQDLSELYCQRLHSLLIAFLVVQQGRTHVDAW